MPQEVSISILQDCDFTIQAATYDTGATDPADGGYDWSPAPALAFEVDEVEYKENISHADHSTGQGMVSVNRRKKRDWTLTIKTKASNASLVNLVSHGRMFLIVASAPTGFSATFFGSKGSPGLTYSDPSTFEFSVKAYGQVPVFS
jgi:hypothetical protein